MFMDWKEILLISVLPKAIYRFTVVPLHTSMTFFAEIKNEPMPKFIKNLKVSLIAKTILGKNKLEDSYFHISKLTTKLK